jgi:hypothetical protein
MNNMYYAKHVQRGKWIHRDHVDLVSQGGWLLADSPAFALVAPLDELPVADGSTPPFEIIIAVPEEEAQEEIRAVGYEACDTCGCWTTNKPIVVGQQSGPHVADSGDVYAIYCDDCKAA